MPTTPSGAPGRHVVLGSGPAGTALAAELAGRGHQVRLVNRGGAGPAVEGVERHAADVGDAEQARAAVKGADVVYHCVNVPYALQTRVLPGVQEAVLAAAEGEGARLVVLDTLYPYGETRGAVMTEETSWNATSRKGRLRADLDRGYLEAHRAGRVRTVMGRSADFVGPGVLVSSLAGAVFPGALTGGEVLGIGDLDRLHSYTYIGDVAAGLAVLGEHPEGDGRVWHLPTPPAVTTREAHRMIEQRVGRPLNVVVLDRPRPYGPFDQEFMDEYAELFYQHTEDQVMDSSAFEAAFGTRPTELGTALDRTIEWYRGLLAAG
ncbi:NAD-dependent epimerase/dehydratase family protein [Allonocardiopsis opalescens]|uniref:Nucleoside-diphosphate-sugar epimerase n=1 Tax=Allonocardiopsis opalescens TaxID=1144618 RepID=A0A2T0QEF5_9ACTN|nr:NAD-dependent epimerase/dehydratase family protein [Allonocardiopsis opalescens]PRY02298.1 nucleoside-diphosphate-sugar epimerase [Allonocardiopsis opalescens]